MGQSDSFERILQEGGGASAVVRCLKARNGNDLVLKDFSQSPAWFRRTIGALLARREASAYRRLQGLSSIPCFLGRRGPDGVLIEFVATQEWSQAGPRLTHDFFEDLRRCLDSLRSRGVLHLDVAGNVAVDRNGKPVLFDFASTLVIPRWLSPLKPALCRLRSGYDARATVRLKKRHAPHLLQDGDAKTLERVMTGEVWIKRLERWLARCVGCIDRTASLRFPARATRRLYNGLASMTTWLILVPWHLVLIAASKFTRQELNQRLGRVTSPVKKRPRIQIHAVSLGEMTLCRGVLKRLLPDEGIEVVLTAGNQQALAMARSLQGEFRQVIDVVLLAWDRRAGVGSWLAGCRPDLVCVVETEIWPNLFLECRERNIPLIMINARLYPKDVARYRLMRGFFKHVLEAATWIGVSDQAERERFLRIGAPPQRLGVMGNAKYDQFGKEAPRISRRDLGIDLGERRVYQPSFIICAASTHHPEERLLLHTLVRLRTKKPGLKLILAPRSLRSCRPALREAERLELKTARWPGTPADWDVLVVEQYGWLAEMFDLCDLVFIGGSLVEIGGHNFLEAAARRRPIVVGPHFQHFDVLLAQFLEKKAIVQIDGPEELRGAMEELIDNRDARDRLAGNALRQLRSQGGASRRYACLMKELLPRERARTALERPKANELTTAVLIR